ncbi:hypothetical protein [Actinokineospora terrae]|uniref:Uncharacterized protein n=1 Tax=Actinokineospora terrae TaxID=155974 RepID=A0A1H9KL27_9PSEU|nr:hypothetical protein [Actinokineospora terrae]SEQ99846.1 hypothetical protein SAMN04487818_101227 [Actinokineospora terrae]
MLAVSTYSQEYIDTCRARVADHVSAYRAMTATGDGPEFTAAVAAFEPVFFTNLVHVLETSFVHRLRGKENKDGNPLNEVRLISASVLADDGVLRVDKGIKWDPLSTVLGYAPGDRIEVREAGFLALAEAFFTDLTAKYA